MKTTGLALTADVELDSDAVGGVAAGAAPVALVALARTPYAALPPCVHTPLPCLRHPRLCDL